VADLRASTPTDAAKRVVPDVSEERARVQQARAGMRSRVTQRVAIEVDRMGALRSRPVLSSSAWMLDSRAEEVGRYASRTRELVDRHLERCTTAVAEHVATLRALSPQRTLERGYAVVQLADGRAVRDAAEAPVGTRLLVTVAVGSLGARVEAPAAGGHGGSG